MRFLKFNEEAGAAVAPGDRAVFFNGPKQATGLAVAPVYQGASWAVYASDSGGRWNFMVVDAKKVQSGGKFQPTPEEVAGMQKFLPYVQPGWQAAIQKLIPQQPAAQQQPQQAGNQQAQGQQQQGQQANQQQQPQNDKDLWSDVTPDTQNSAQAITYSYEVGHDELIASPGNYLHADSDDLHKGDILKGQTPGQTFMTIQGRLSMDQGTTYVTAHTRQGANVWGYMPKIASYLMGHFPQMFPDPKKVGVVIGGKAQYLSNLPGGANVGPAKNPNYHWMAQPDQIDREKWGQKYTQGQSQPQQQQQQPNLFRQGVQAGRAADKVAQSRYLSGGVSGGTAGKTVRDMEYDKLPSFYKRKGVNPFGDWTVPNSFKSFMENF